MVTAAYLLWPQAMVVGMMMIVILMDMPTHLIL